MDDMGYQQDLRMLLKTLQKRCPADAVCGELLDCLESAERDRVRRCCDLRVASLKSSYNLLAQGAAHMQLGVLRAMDGCADLTDALNELRRAERIFRICDRTCATIALMAVGKACERDSQWKKAALSYQQSIDRLSDLHDPLVKTAREWQAAVIKNAAMEQASQPGAQDSSPSPTQAADTATEQSTQEQQASAPGEQMAEEKMAQPGPSLWQSDNAQSATSRRRTRPPEPPILPRLRLVPFFEGRVVAGRRLSVLVKEGPPVTVDILWVEDRPFYVREVPVRRHGGSLDGFDFALLVIGDSMEPTICEGDCVLVRKTSPVQGDIVVARIPDGEEDLVTIKRFDQKADYVLLTPDNPDCNSIVIVADKELKQSLEPQLRAEYGDRLEIIVGPHSLIEGRVSVILSPKSTDPPTQ